jgi:hypothetical protein
MKRIYKLGIIIALAIFSFASCTKWTEIKPEGTFLEEDAVKSGQDVIKILNSTYDALANRFGGSSRCVQVYNDLLGDELADFNINGSFRQVYLRSTGNFERDFRDDYQGLYRCVYRVNTCQEYINKFNDLSAEEKNTIQGETRFIKALAHFEIARLWAQPYGSAININASQSGIPLRKSVSIEPVLRSTLLQTYEYIANELKDAINLLPETNPRNTNKKTYADKNAAKALLAKVYFHTNQYSLSIPLLNEVIAANQNMFSDSLNHFDNANFGKEYLFAFVSTGNTDNRGQCFTSNYRSDNVDIARMLISQTAYDFMKTDTSDKRLSLIKVNKPGTSSESYASKKYDFNFLDVPYLLLTDMYLMRAEALAITNQNIPTAVADINKIISRAYRSPASKLLTGSESVNTIKQRIRDERRKEFLLEGDRVQTFKRIGANGETTDKVRNAAFNCNGLIFAFHVTEISKGFLQNAQENCN